MRYEHWQVAADSPVRHPDDRKEPSDLLIAPEDPRYDRLTAGQTLIGAIEAGSYEEIRNIWHGRIYGATPAERIAHLRKLREDQPPPDSN
jgi:hypothetical protein